MKRSLALIHRAALSATTQKQVASAFRGVVGATHIPTCCLSQQVRVMNIYQEQSRFFSQHQIFSEEQKQETPSTTTAATSEEHHLLIDLDAIRSTPTEESFLEQVSKIIQDGNNLIQKLEGSASKFNLKGDETPLTKIAGHSIPKEMWDIVNALLQRTFLYVHIFSNVEKAKSDLEKLKTMYERLNLIVIINGQHDSKKENDETETEYEMVQRLQHTIKLIEKENEVYEITNTLMDLQRRSMEIVEPAFEPSSNPLENQILEEAYKKQGASLENPGIEEIRIKVLELLERRYHIYTEFGNAKEAHTDLCNAIELLEEDILKLEQMEGVDPERLEKRKLWVARLLVDRAELYFTFLHSLYQGPQIEESLDKSLTQKQRAEIVLEDIHSKITQLADMLGIEDEELRNPSQSASKNVSIVKATKYQVEADNRMKSDLQHAVKYDPKISEHHTSYSTIQDFMKEIGDKRKRAGFILRFIIIFFIIFTVGNIVYMKSKSDSEKK